MVYGYPRWRVGARGARVWVPRAGSMRSWSGGAREMASAWLGRQDSNLGSWIQSPLPYRLATPEWYCGDVHVGWGWRR
jgi:hypothetical protein